jgi:hypothetical protein
MAKPSRQEYLNQRLTEAKKVNPNVSIQIPTNPTSAQLKSLDAQLNKVIYPSGQYGVTGSAAAVVDPATAAANAAKDAVNAQNAAAQQQQRTDWIEQLTILFKNYGLETLAPKIKEFVQQGYSADTVTLKLQESPEYQQRFVGNAARLKAGLSVLSPKEYLATEDAYRQIMRSTGLPKGFYDSPDDFSKFIESDVSPTELKQRVDLAQNAIDNADPYYTRSLQEMYGLSNGDMIAQVLDPQRAMPFITKQAQAVQFGAAAARQGLSVDMGTAEQFAGMGVTKQQAEQGFQDIAGLLPTANKLSSIYNQEQGYGQKEATAEIFGGPNSAEMAARRKRLSQMETATFSGSSGTGKSSFAQQQTGRI